MQTIAVTEAKMSDLVNFYNTHTVRLQDGKPVKKFADRKTAEVRVNKLVEALASYFPKDEDTVPPEGMIFVGELENDEGEPLKIEVNGAAPVAKMELVEEGTEEEDAKDVNSFASMGAAMAALGDKADTAPARSAGRASNSLGVALSWLQPDVRVRRLTRDSVSVTVDGATHEFKSAQDAFRLFRLPESKFIRFRIKLKAARKETFEFGGKSYVFTIVEGGAEE